MFSKTASLAIVAMLSLSGAMAISPFGPPSTAGIAQDESQFDNYCGIGNRITNQAYACFLFSGDIRNSMLEPFNAHGYMNTDGSRFVLVWQGRTQAFAFDDVTVTITKGKSNCLDVAMTSLNPGTTQTVGPARHVTACPNSDLIPIS